MRTIHKDAEEKKTSFNPRPYFRLFINWLLDLTTLEPVTDGANLQVRCMAFRFVLACHMSTFQTYLKVTQRKILNYFVFFRF